jgi:hypothetical protein
VATTGIFAVLHSVRIPETDSSVIRSGKLLLALASTVILEFLGTHDHIIPPRGSE